MLKTIQNLRTFASHFIIVRRADDENSHVSSSATSKLQSSMSSPAATCTVPSCLSDRSPSTNTRKRLRSSGTSSNEFYEVSVEEVQDFLIRNITDSFQNVLNEARTTFVENAMASLSESSRSNNRKLRSVRMLMRQGSLKVKWAMLGINTLSQCCEANVSRKSTTTTAALPATISLKIEIDFIGNQRKSFSLHMYTNGKIMGTSTSNCGKLDNAAISFDTIALLQCMRRKCDHLVRKAHRDALETVRLHPPTLMPPLEKAIRVGLPQDEKSVTTKGDQRPLSFASLPVYNPERPSRLVSIATRAA